MKQTYYLMPMLGVGALAVGLFLWARSGDLQRPLPTPLSTPAPVTAALLRTGATEQETAEEVEEPYRADEYVGAY